MPGGTTDAAPMKDNKDMVGTLGISRSRDGSGTSWNPDDSPVYALMTNLGGFRLMLHENVFVGYDWFSGARGDARFMSTNWVMAKASHDLGPGEIGARAMLSAEPLTVGLQGYPLIFQTGDTARGKTLHDHQHPHELFVELAAMYTVPLSDDVGIELYVAPAGEPALGPTTVMHRLSSMPDPLIPIGHDWEDSTHISFGVITAAVFSKTLKLDASWFNGREGDENRYDLDLRVPDSVSVRLTWNPTSAWSAQASYGYLASPEAQEPNVSVNRLTASATYDAANVVGANVATTFIAGTNIENTGQVTPAFALENAWDIDGHNQLFGRLEYVLKSGGQLALPSSHGSEELFSTGLADIGYVYSFGPYFGLQPGVGARGSIGIADPALAGVYGTHFPLGAVLFVQLRPGAMSP